MTREEIEMLEGTTEIVDALRDQMRTTRAGRPVSDLQIEHRLNDISVQLHTVISRALQENLIP